jgi:hypothetical protein
MGDVIDQRISCTASFCIRSLSGHANLCVDCRVCYVELADLRARALMLSRLPGGSKTISCVWPLPVNYGHGIFPSPRDTASSPALRPCASGKKKEKNSTTHQPFQAPTSICLFLFSSVSSGNSVDGATADRPDPYTTVITRPPAPLKTAGQPTPQPHHSSSSCAPAWPCYKSYLFAAHDTICDHTKATDSAATLRTHTRTHTQRNDGASRALRPPSSRACARSLSVPFL